MQMGVEQEDETEEEREKRERKMQKKEKKKRNRETEEQMESDSEINEIKMLKMNNEGNEENAPTNNSKEKQMHTIPSAYHIDTEIYYEPEIDNNDNGEDPITRDMMRFWKKETE